MGTVAKDRSESSLPETMTADPMGIRGLPNETRVTGSSSRVRLSKAKVETEMEENDRKS